MHKQSLPEDDECTQASHYNITGCIPNCLEVSPPFMPPGNPSLPLPPSRRPLSQTPPTTNTTTPLPDPKKIYNTVGYHCSNRPPPSVSLRTKKLSSGPNSVGLGSVGRVRQPLGRALLPFMQFSAVSVEQGPVAHWGRGLLQTDVFGMIPGNPQSAGPGLAHPWVPTATPLQIRAQCPQLVTPHFGSRIQPNSPKSSAELLGFCILGLQWGNSGVACLSSTVCHSVHCSPDI